MTPVLSATADDDMNDKQMAATPTHPNGNTKSINIKTVKPKQQWIANVDNLDEYKKSYVIINVNVENKIVFQLFGQHGYIQKLITSEKVVYSLIVLIAFGFITAFAILIFDGQNVWYFATLTTTYCIGVILQIIALLNAHKMVYSLTFNTFDFWFILWNAINVVTCNTILGIYHHPFVWYAITRAVGAFTTAMALVCIDAMHMSRQVKIICRTMVVLYFSFLVISFYFSGKDAEWNPFESYDIKESNISFKSVYLSSMINIILFSAKPLFKDIRRLLRKMTSPTLNCNCLDPNIMTTIHSKPNSCDDDQRHNDKNYQRCEFLYTKPYVRWKKKQLTVK